MKRLFRKFNLHEGKKGSAITVHVVPGMAEKKIVEVKDDGTLVVEMDTKDVAGKTNQLLVKYFASILDVTQDDIEVVAGSEGADKLISIINTNTDEVNKHLMMLVQK
jgi:uncharacterized protein YggU (UPF0235/DUF167 family)